jgi:ketosteroid isomerase-like protein
MSQENVEIGRRVWEHFNERRWDAFWSLVDGKVEWQSRTDEPDAGVHYGMESAQRYMDSWIELFPDLRVELAESVDLGDHVATELDLVGNARISGIEFREHYCFLSTIENRKIVLIREFHENKEAIDTVGLVE